MKEREETPPKTTMSACEFLVKLTQRPLVRLTQRPSIIGVGVFDTVFTAIGSDYERRKMLEDIYLMQRAQAACSLGMQASLLEGASLNEVEFTEDKAKPSKTMG